LGSVTGLGYLSYTNPSDPTQPDFRSAMTTQLFLRRIYLKSDATFADGEFPFTLPFVRGLDLHFEKPVTILVGENGSGKSTLTEAIAELSGLPVGGGGRNELADLRSPHDRSELAPVLRAAFRKKPKDGYFFRAEFQAHFATLLEQRKADPDFLGDPYARYGGRSLHTRSHGEAFLAVLSSWLSPGLIVMDEPESALSPQRQLVLLAQMARLLRDEQTQFVVATHSPILMTYPGASLLSLDGEGIAPIRLEDTSHFQITKGLLDCPTRYWKHLLSDDEAD
jgi:predicted ATPase